MKKISGKFGKMLRKIRWNSGNVWEIVRKISRKLWVNYESDLHKFQAKFVIIVYDILRKFWDNFKDILGKIWGRVKKIFQF